MNHLEMPGPLSGGGLKRNQAGTVQIVTGVVSPVIVYGDAIGRDINQVERRIGGKRGPGRDVTGILPGIVLPGFVAEFAGSGNYVELPLEAAGPRVVGKNIARHILNTRLMVSLFGGVADDYRVIDHNGW